MGQVLYVMANDLVSLCLTVEVISNYTVSNRKPTICMCKNADSMNHFFACLCVCLSVCVSFYLSVCLSVCLCLTTSVVLLCLSY